MKVIRTEQHLAQATHTEEAAGSTSLEAVSVCDSEGS